MKIYITNHRCNDDEIEAKNGIRVLIERVMRLLSI